MEQIIQSLERLKITPSAGCVHKSSPANNNPTKKDLVNISLQLWHDNKQLKSENNHLRNELRNLRALVACNSQMKIPEWIT